MLDDTGFKHLRVKVVASGLSEARGVLHRLFESPDILAMLMEAGIVSGRPYFEVEIFGISSRIDEVLEQVDLALQPDVRDSPLASRVSAGPQKVHAGP